MNSFENLEKIFADFPGIGPRQAKRFVYFLLSRNKSYINDLSNQISSLQEEMEHCQKCFRFYLKEKGGSKICSVCRDSNRDDSSIMIVSRDVDFENIEKSDAYNGLYFILGGSVGILSKEPEKRVRLAELLNRISELSKNGLKEIVLALNANPEGENTADFIKEKISSIADSNGIKISTLGRGLSTGLELEYSDSETLKSAFKHRE